MKTYLNLWILATMFLTYEYFALNFFPAKSVFHLLGYAQITPNPGGSLSLFLGWAGIILMLSMNLYILRKRSALFAKLGGSLSQWLNFHIFCGLVGPTFILFHCNFKVRGLVAISFWSMIVAASSGVVGRYFYTQLLKVKKETTDEANIWAEKLAVLQKASPTPIPNEKIEALKRLALNYVGVLDGAINADGTLSWGTMRVFTQSLAGDIRLMFDLPLTIKELPYSSRVLLKNYAISTRRNLFLEPFKNLMGYWHTFHTPFAVFMYLAAIIHIAAALLLGVRH